MSHCGNISVYSSVPVDDVGFFVKCRGRVRRFIGDKGRGRQGKSSDGRAGGTSLEGRLVGGASDGGAGLSRSGPPSRDSRNGQVPDGGAVGRLLPRSLRGCRGPFLVLAPWSGPASAPSKGWSKLSRGPGHAPQGGAAGPSHRCVMFLGAAAPLSRPSARLAGGQQGVGALAAPHPHPLLPACSLWLRNQLAQTWWLTTHISSISVEAKVDRNQGVSAEPSFLEARGQIRSRGFSSS